MLGMISTRQYLERISPVEETQGPSLTSMETYFASGMEQIFSYESKEKSNARFLVQGPIPLFSKAICLFYSENYKVFMLQSIAHKAVENRRHSFFSDQGSTYN